MDKEADRETETDRETYINTNTYTDKGRNREIEKHRQAETHRQAQAFPLVGGGHSGCTTVGRISPLEISYYPHTHC